MAWVGIPSLKKGQLKEGIMDQITKKTSKQNEHIRNA